MNNVSNNTLPVQTPEVRRGNMLILAIFFFAFATLLVFLGIYKNNQNSALSSEMMFAKGDITDTYYETDKADDGSRFVSRELPRKCLSKIGNDRDSCLASYGNYWGVVQFIDEGGAKYKTRLMFEDKAKIDTTRKVDIIYQKSDPSNNYIGTKENFYKNQKEEPNFFIFFTGFSFSISLWFFYKYKKIKLDTAI